MSIKKYIIIAVSILGVLIATKLVIGSEYKETQTVEKDTLDEWLDKLATAENCPTLGIVDSNGKLSVGQYCFQKDTFVTFVKKYNLLPQCEEQEITNWWYDSEFQRVLAKRMLADNIFNYDHWRTSTKKIGKPIPLANSYWKQG